MSRCLWLRAFTCVLCLSLAASAQAVADTAAAERHFTRGYALVEAHEYEAAALEFEQAYAKSPHHSVLYNLGQAYAMAGKHVQAVKALRAFLAEADKAEPALVERAKTTLEKSEHFVGRVRFVVTPVVPDALLILDGQALDAPAGEHLVTPGPHGVWVRGSGYRDSYRSFVVQAGVLSELDVKLERLTASSPAPAKAPRLAPPSAQPPSRVWSYVLGGTSVALGAGALALYAKNSADHREWQAHRDRFAEQNYGTMTAAQRNELGLLLEEATDQQRWDDVALGLGIGAGLSLGAAIVLFLRSAPATQEQSRVSFDGRRIAWSTTW